MTLNRMIRVNDIELEPLNQSGFDIDLEIEKVEKKINGLEIDSVSDPDESLFRANAFDESKKSQKQVIDPVDIVLEVQE